MTEEKKPDNIKKVEVDERTDGEDSNIELVEFPSEEDLETEIVEVPGEEDSDIEIVDLSGEANKYEDIDLDDDEQLKDMLKDFSDIDDLTIEEMLEIQNAIEEVAETTEINVPITVEGKVPTEGIPEVYIDLYEGWGLYEEFKPEFKPDITDDLEALIQEELEKKRIKIKIVTEEAFTQYCLEKRNKIWYHALWTLVFDIEDNQALKETLYELLKEVTSKSPIDPLPEHKFYFGLGFILRLSLNGKKIIEFRGEKLKLNVGIDILNDILRKVGPPISERPILTKTEKKKMFVDFLTDDFKDI